MSASISNELRQQVDVVLCEQVPGERATRAERCAELSSLLFGTALYGDAVEGALAEHA